MGSNDRESAFGLPRPDLLGRMHELEELVAERDQMGQLLELVIGIASDLDLDATLHWIVAAGPQLARALTEGPSRSRRTALLDTDRIRDHPSIN